MRSANPKKLNHINHVALVIDQSSSMLYSGLTQTVIKVADELIQHLAKKSTEMNQETRVTVYVFNNYVECVIFDMDVLRLPSLREYYHPSGSTALVDATVLSIEDLRKTMVKYGDHAFLTYVLTDGEENQSSNINLNKITALLTGLAENETMACLVPNEAGVQAARRFGFPEGNIAVWETSKAGLEKAATTITRSVDSYMTGRATGVRKSSTLFTTDISNVNTKSVNSKNMTALKKGVDYDELKVLKKHDGMQIRDFVEAETGESYQIGKGFYQLMKRETIQPSKAIAIQNKHSGRVYAGDEARQLLGLGDLEVRVTPADNDEYRIYVQSTSVNRKLVGETRLLLMK